MNEKESGVRTLLGASDEGTETPRSAALAQIAFERIGLFAAILGFAVLVVKITRVSHLNARTSQALLAEVGPVEIVLGSLVTHFPLVLFTVSLLVVWWSAGSFALARTVTPAHLGAAGVVAFALLLLPWPFLVVLAVVGALRFNHRRTRPPAGRKLAGYYLVPALVATLLVVDSEVWLAPEVFSIAGEPEVVGYALQEAETTTGWLVVLTDADRSVIRVREEDVSAREPCHHEREHLELETFPSLLQVAIGESATLPEPPCP